MPESQRVTTGITGLDTIMHGGLIPGSAVLVRGAPGTGKTTVGLQYLAEGVQRGEPGLLVSFEEFPQSLYLDAESLGWDLPALEAEGKLHLLFTSPEVLLHGLALPESSIQRMLHQHDIRRVVVDSFSHYTQVYPDTHDLRRAYHQVTSAFRREGITALYLAEEMRSDYTREEKGHLSFVVDCLVMLRYLEIDSAIQRALVVLKMRSSAHDSAIYSYTIGQGGIAIGPKLEGKTGLLSGLAERSMISSVH